MEITPSTAPIFMMAIIAAICALLGCVILNGKGDWLIAGYNTASKKKKEMYNIKRLRWLTTIVCWVAAVYCMLLPFFHNDMQIMALTFGFVGITLVMAILANTWAKRI